MSLLEEHFAAFAREAGMPPPQHAHVASGLEALSVDLPGGLTLTITGDAGYPALPPLVTIQAPWMGDAPRTLPIQWIEQQPPHRRLSEALLACFLPPGPYLPVWGPSPDALLTRDPDRARLAGWPCWYSGRAVEDGPWRAALRARSGGLLHHASLPQRRVFLAGAGSVGSYLADVLTRSGVESWTLLDPECVDPANICRTVYRVQDAGRPKTEALAAHLLSIAPHASIRIIGGSVQDLEGGRLREELDSCALVLGCTDDPAAQTILNRVAFHSEVPALFCGIYASARGGEVIPVIPGVTPCLRCATGARYASDAPWSRTRDYGTGRLAGEPALACDIQHVASAAAKIALSLLTLDGEGPVASFFPGALIHAGHWLMLGQSPDLSFRPAAMPSPGTWAFDALWLSSASQDACPVCGPRAEPSAEVTAPPDLQALRTAFASLQPALAEEADDSCPSGPALDTSTPVALHFLTEEDDDPSSAGLPLTGEDDDQFLPPPV